MKKTNLLKLETVDLWMEEAAALGFHAVRCDEFAEWIIELYKATPAEETATMLAHLFWPQGHEVLYDWQVYAIWSHLEKLSDRELCEEEAAE